MRLLVAGLLGLCAASGWAAALKPFGPGSMEALLATHKGQPFILGFWSLSCAYCRDDLELFARLARRHPRLALEVIATDGPGQGDAAAEVLRQYGLDTGTGWIFDDPMVERLYYEVDRKWRGELPRSYFFDADHHVRAVSGKLDEAETENWVKRQLGQ